jgi:hypothetical protein
MCAQRGRLPITSHRLSWGRADDAVDRRPSDSGQPVNLGLAEACLDRGAHHLVALARHRAPLGGPRGQYLAGLPHGQLRHASRTTFL